MATTYHIVLITYQLRFNLRLFIVKITRLLRSSFKSKYLEAPNHSIIRLMRSAIPGEELTLQQKYYIKQYYQDTLPQYVNTKFQQIYSKSQDQMNVVSAITQFNTFIYSLRAVTSIYLEDVVFIEILSNFNEKFVCRNLQLDPYNDPNLKWSLYLRLCCWRLASNLKQQQLPRQSKFQNEQWSSSLQQVKKLGWKIRLNFQFTEDLGASQKYFIQLIDQLTQPPIKNSDDFQNKLEQIVIDNGFRINQIFKKNDQIKVIDQQILKNEEKKKPLEEYQEASPSVKSENQRLECEASPFEESLEQLRPFLFPQIKKTENQTKKFKPKKRQAPVRTIYASNPMKYKARMCKKNKVQHISEKSQQKQKKQAQQRQQINYSQKGNW